MNRENFNNHTKVLYTFFVTQSFVVFFYKTRNTKLFSVACIFFLVKKKTNQIVKCFLKL